MYVPTADDIGTMLKCEVQSRRFENARSSCECGPVVLDPEFQHLLHSFMQDLKNSKNSIVYKVFEGDAEMYIAVNIEKLKIKNAKKKTIEKEAWVESTKVQILFLLLLIRKLNFHEGQILYQLHSFCK